MPPGMMLGMFVEREMPNKRCVFCDGPTQRMTETKKGAKPPYLVYVTFFAIS
jgi:hypothetical protein